MHAATRRLHDILPSSPPPPAFLLRDGDSPAALRRRPPAPSRLPANALMPRRGRHGMDAAKCVPPANRGASGAWKIMGDGGMRRPAGPCGQASRAVPDGVLCGLLAARFGLPALGPAAAVAGAGQPARTGAAGGEEGPAPEKAAPEAPFLRGR